RLGSVPVGAESPKEGTCCLVDRFACFRWSGFGGQVDRGDRLAQFAGADPRAQVPSCHQVIAPGQPGFTQMGGPVPADTGRTCDLVHVVDRPITGLRRPRVEMGVEEKGKSLGVERGLWATLSRPVEACADSG